MHTNASRAASLERRNRPARSARSIATSRRCGKRFVRSCVGPAPVCCSTIPLRPSATYFLLQTPLGIAHFRGGHRGGTGRDGRRRNGPACAPAGERRWLPWLQTSGQIGQLFIHVNQPRHREVPAPENHPILHTGVRVCWTSFPPHRLNRRPGKSPASGCCRSETSAVEPYPPIHPGNRGR